MTLLIRITAHALSGRGGSNTPLPGRNATRDRSTLPRGEEGFDRGRTAHELLRPLWRP